MIRADFWFETKEASAAFLAGVKFGRKAKKHPDLKYDADQPEVINAYVSEIDHLILLQCLKQMVKTKQEMEDGA